MKPARQYVSLFETLANRMTFTGQENLALRVSSLRAIPPPPPEVRPMEGLSGVNLLEASLVQWSSYVQDIAAGMQLPPKVAMDCPDEDIMGVLHRLELETKVPFCRFCLAVGGYCRCKSSAPPPQTPLWSPLAYSHATMAAATATTASTSGVGVPTSVDPPPGFPALPSSGTSPIAEAGRGRGKLIQEKLARATTPAIRQVHPTALPQQQVMAEAAPATPYKQQVFPPLPPPPQPTREARSRPTTTQASTSGTSTTPTGAASAEASTRGHPRERSSARGSRNADSHQSSTRGSCKRLQTAISERSMDDLNWYRPSGWRRDLIHITSYYYAEQVGSVAEGSQPWEDHCQKFLDVMEQRQASMWLDIKELHPLDFMGYVASVFLETTGHFLRDLSSYTGWMRPGGYYHWKMAELGQLDRCENLRGRRPPKGAILRPSIKLQRDTRKAQEKAKEKAKEAKEAQRPDGDEATTSASRDESATTPMEVDRQPQAEAGGGDSRSWYDQSVKEENKRLKEEVKRLRKALDKCPSSTPVTRPTRPKHMEAVYSDITKRELPWDNIASPAVQACYPNFDYNKVRTLSNHILAMIADYHATCVVNGPGMTCPVTSPQIKERLAPWKHYAPPAGTGMTDVRIADSQAKTLRVAVWLHRLDMSLSDRYDASRSLVPSRHTQGLLLTYFLAPGTSFLTFDKVLARVIHDNHKFLNRNQEILTTSLAGFNLWRTAYLDELSSLSRQLDSTGNASTKGDLEARISLV